MNVVSIGEVLWDVVGDQEHLGGATFNFSAHLSRLGHRVSFISAVGADERGRRILDCMRQLGLSTRYVREAPDHATGFVSVTLASDGQPTFVLHRPAAYDFPELSDAGLKELRSDNVDWIYFGTLLHVSPQAKQLTFKLLNALRDSRRFYDVNLRAGAYDEVLLRELMAQATVVKLNDSEVREIGRMFGQPQISIEQFCRRFARDFGWKSVCVTRGAEGCSLLLDEEFVEAEGYAVLVADAVGAGDAFAAGFLHGLGSGWPAAQIADFANRVGALIASRPGAVPLWTLAEVEGLQRKTNFRETA